MGYLAWGLLWVVTIFLAYGMGKIDGKWDVMQRLPDDIKRRLKT